MTDLRIEPTSGGYQILGTDNNGVEVLADWATYATEQEAREAAATLRESLEADARESLEQQVHDLRRLADDLGVIVGEFRVNSDKTIEICGVDGTDETVADVAAARRWLREAAE